MTLLDTKVPRVYAAAGAIDIHATAVFIGGGSATALTLADPGGLPDGQTMGIVAITAQAHTVTNTTGFNAGGTDSDVATYGGAIGDSMILIARNGVWYTLGGLRNVTLG